jgi:hypothetical protein
MRFTDWKDLVAKGDKVADAVAIAVLDGEHAEVVKAFAEQGYAILCEKVGRFGAPRPVQREWGGWGNGSSLTGLLSSRPPLSQPIATTIDDCIEIVGHVEKNNVIFGCGHGEAGRSPLIH